MEMDKDGEQKGDLQTVCMAVYLQAEMRFLYMKGHVGLCWSDSQ